MHHKRKWRLKFGLKIGKFANSWTLEFPRKKYFINAVVLFSPPKYQISTYILRFHIRLSLNGLTQTWTVAYPLYSLWFGVWLFQGLWHRSSRGLQSRQSQMMTNDFADNRKVPKSPNSTCFINSKFKIRIFKFSLCKSENEWLRILIVVQI